VGDGEEGASAVVDLFGDGAEGNADEGQDDEVAGVGVRVDR